MRTAAAALAIALSACGVKAPPRPPLAQVAGPAAPAPDGGGPLGEHCLAPECAGAPAPDGGGPPDGGVLPDGGVPPDGGRP